MCGDEFYKKSQIWKKIVLFFLQLFFHVITPPIELKRQSEHSGLRPDSSSLISNSFTNGRS